MLKLLILCFFLASTLSFTIKLGSPFLFPIQHPLEDNSNAFVRIDSRNNKTEVVSCPPRHIFNRHLLKCTQTTNIHHRANSFHEYTCPNQFTGLLPQKMNCRQFVNCWYGVGFESDCYGHLLFNDEKKWCDYPQEAGCCEYWERDSSQIVE